MSWICTGHGLAEKTSFLAPLVYPPRLITVNPDQYAVRLHRDEALTNMNFVFDYMLDNLSAGPRRRVNEDLDAASDFGAVRGTVPRACGINVHPHSFAIVQFEDGLHEMR